MKTLSLLALLGLINGLKVTHENSDFPPDSTLV